MTFIENGKLSPDVARWVAPAVSVVVLLGGLITIYTGLQSQGAVQDERIRSLESRMNIVSVDHDMLLQINVRLANIEATLTGRQAPNH